MKRLFLTTSLAVAGLSCGMAATAAAMPAPDAGVSVSSAVLVQVAAASPAKEFIEKMGHSAIGFLDNQSLSQAQKEAEFKKLLQSSFDMKTIGRFALGQYWNGATPAQRNEYQKLFETMIVKVYSARFNEYQGQKLDVAGVREDGKDSIVTSYIVPNSGAKIRVDWRVRSKGNSHKIVDVIIEGVSMAMTQRSDFSSVIQRGGGNIDVLIAHLKK